MAPGTCSETERDLHLAAQLGRALLERNNELEEMIREQELDIDQKNSEIQFLTRHVEMLREDFDSYLAQEEHNSQQLEGKISELEEEKKVNRETIKRLKRKINELETHSAELEQEVDKFAVTQESMTRSKCHCDSLSLTHDSTFDDDEEPQPRLPLSQSTPLVSREMMNEISDMENHIAHLQSDLDDYKAKYRQERIASETLRRDVEQIALEKSLLEDQLSLCKNKLNSSKSLEAELKKWRQENSSLENKSSLEKECEFEELDIQKGVLIKLGNGVQAYGSEDSFSSEDDFAHLDEDGDDDDSSNSRRPSLLEELLHDGHPPPSSLTPPDSPDKNTFGQLFASEAQPPSSTIAVQTEQGGDNELAAEDEGFPLEPLSNPFENSFRKTPEYKSLFQEIFLVLKRTVGGNSRSPKKEAIPLSVFGK